VTKSYLNPEFYSTWPSFGKNLSFQWDEIRRDLNVLNAIAKGEVLETDDTTGLERSRLAGLELGQYIKHNEYRFFFDKTDDLLKVQRNTGTEDIPVWVTVLSFNGTGGAIGKVQERGGSGTPDVFYFPHTLYVQRPDLTVENNGDGQPVIQYNSQFRVDESGVAADEDVLNVTRLRVQVGTGLQVIEEGTGIARLEFNDIGSVNTFYFQTPRKEWVVNHNMGTSHVQWDIFNTKFRPIFATNFYWRTPQFNLNDADFSNPNVAYFYFRDLQAGFATISGGGLAQVNANIVVRDGFHEVTDDELNFNGADFYITRRANGAPVINLQPAGSNIDHGTLQGLADDDHPQYILAAGTRAFSGVLTGNLHVDQVVVAEAFYLQPGSGGEISKSGEDILIRPIVGGKIDLRGHVAIGDTLNVANAVTAEAFYLTNGGEIGSSGEINTASNLGAGSGVFAQKVGVDLQFKSLVAGTNITLTPAANTITIDATASGGGGGFYGVIFKDGDTVLRNDTIRFNSNEFYLTLEGSKPQLNLLAGVVGEANTASNLGTGSGVFDQKVGVDLQFKSLTAGSNITLTPSGTDITIASTASGGAGGGFYGVIFKETEVGSKLYRVDTLTFFSDGFYLTPDSLGHPVVSLTGPTRKLVQPFTNAVEVNIPHNFGNSDIVWSVYDNDKKGMLPMTAYVYITGADFYFVENTSGKIVLIG